MTKPEPQITHSDHCWSYGPKHYECALKHIERQHDRLVRLTREVESVLIEMEEGLIDATARPPA
jgi:hypothetical protein